MAVAGAQGLDFRAVLGPQVDDHLGLAVTPDELWWFVPEQWSNPPGDLRTRPPEFWVDHVHDSVWG